MQNGNAPHGYLAMLLHAHLPYVRHPEHPEFLEEDWLFEAITETYLPLIAMMQRIVAARSDQENAPAAFD